MRCPMQKELPKQQGFFSCLILQEIVKGVKLFQPTHASFLANISVS